jgi:hypothetical protein
VSDPQHNPLGSCNGQEEQITKVQSDYAGLYPSGVLFCGCFRVQRPVEPRDHCCGSGPAIVFGHSFFVLTEQTFGSMRCPNIGCQPWQLLYNLPDPDAHGARRGFCFVQLLIRIRTSWALVAANFMCQNIELALSTSVYYISSPAVWLLNKIVEKIVE